MGYKNRFRYGFEDIATIIMPLLLVVSEITGSAAPFYVTIVISLIMIGHPFVIFPAYFVSALSSTYFSPVEGLSAGRVLSIILILSLLLNTIYGPREGVNKSQQNRITVYSILLILFNFFSSVISLSGTFNSFFIMLQNLLVLLLLTKQTRVNIEKLTNMIYWASVVVLIGLAYEAFSSGISLMADERYTVESTNENNFAMMCAQLGAVLASSVFIQKKLWSRGFSIVLVFVSLGIIFITGSRASLLGLLSSIAFMVFISMSGAPLKKAFILLLFFVPVYLFYNFAMESEFGVIQRFTVESVVDTGGSGRTDIINRIFKEIVPNHFLFGVGIGGLNIMAAGIPKPSHNILIDPLAQIGIVGLILYWSLIIPIIKKAFRRIPDDNRILLPLSLFVTGLVNGIGETIFYEKFFWNTIALCAMYAIVIGESKQNHGKV